MVEHREIACIRLRESKEACARFVCSTELPTKPSVSLNGQFPSQVRPPAIATTTKGAVTKVAALDFQKC